MNMFATALDKLSSPPPPPPLSPSSSSSSSSPSLSYDSFTFEYRQTKVALAMIVSVSNIVPSSVKIKFNTKGCDVCFEDSNEKLYGMGFEVSKELNLEKCSHDVASNNMVIILPKPRTCYVSGWK